MILKPIKINEAGDYLRWLKDEEVRKFLSTDYSKLTYKKEIDFINKARKDKIKLNWSIYADGVKHIGAAGFDKIDKPNKKITFGIFIGEKNYWSRGYGSDTLKSLLEFAFIKMKFNKVELSVFKGNIGGIKCYKKCGLIIEGVKRESKIINGKFTDEIIMGILKSEYKKFNNKII